MNPITVLLAEDHQIVRAGLRSILENSTDFKVVGEAEKGLQAIAMSTRLCPSVVVMDITMPLMDGLEATRQILQNNPIIKVLVLTAHADPHFIEHAMKLGAAGYLTKDTAAVLPEAIRAVCGGVSFFSPGNSPLKIS
ncbi:MAG: response regulator transcription factor [Prosthecobacter sp.]